VAGTRIELPAAVDDWDATTPIEVSSEVSIDVDHVRRACELRAEDSIAIVAIWHDSATNVRGVGIEVPVSASMSVPLQFAIEPDLVAGAVTLSRLVVLHGVASAIGARDPLVAHGRGAILWRETRHDHGLLELRPTEGSISVEAVDFGEVGDIDPGAPWRVAADVDDLDAPAGRSLELLVNLRHRDVARVLADDDDPRARAVQSVLRWDVARQLVDRALDDDRFVAGFGDFAPGTVGGSLQALFERWLPELTPQQARDRRQRRPGQFEALLQARMEMLGWR
jgi:hypothetical protein